MEFKLLVDTNYRALEDRINADIKLGWEPIGPIVIDIDLRKNYIQSMKKEEKFPMFVGELSGEQVKPKRGRPAKKEQEINV